MYQQMTDLLSERVSGAFEPLCYSNMSHRHDNVNVSQHELYLAAMPNVIIFTCAFAVDMSKSSRTKGLF